MLQTGDYIAIVGYLLLTVFIGIKVGGKPTSASSYFKTSGDIPWWAASFSIVATETSMLTVISVPAISYLGTLHFLQLGFGYIIGRVILSFSLLPSYFMGEQETAYTFLGNRFGKSFKRFISAIFLITRLLADGVRLFAAAIPIKLITGFDYTTSIAIIALLTLAYTYRGGLKSVIWIDVLQLGIYILGGFLIIFFINGQMATPLLDKPGILDKLSFIKLPTSFTDVFLSPYNIVGAVLGGTFLTMASHGTDHLIVQRLLACPNLTDARKALISSGIIICLQFLLFLVVGIYLYHFYDGATPAQLSLTRADEIVPKYVIEVLPAGISGLIIAGLFAAAMSTLSSSLSALSSSTLYDLIPSLSKKKKAMHFSRYLMVFWTFIFFIFAISFSSMNNPVIELGLGIAGFTYGGLLGAFLLGRYTSVNLKSAVTGLIICIISMIGIITFELMAWPWYTLSGVVIYAASVAILHLVSGRK